MSRMALVALISLLVVYPAQAQAQESDPIEYPLTLIGVPSAEVPAEVAGSTENELPVVASSIAKPKRRVLNRKFWLVTGMNVVLMVADTAITLKQLPKCPTCSEENPYTAPFINAGPKVVYPALFAFGTGVTIMDWKLKKSDSPPIPWWVAPFSIAAGNVWGIVGNLLD